MRRPGPSKSSVRRSERCFPENPNSFTPSLPSLLSLPPLSSHSHSFLSFLFPGSHRYLLEGRDSSSLWCSTWVYETGGPTTRGNPRP